MPADLAAENPLLRTLARESGRVLERAVARLRPAYRGILLLRFAQEMSYDEIAEVLGLPLGHGEDPHFSRPRRAAPGDAGAGARSRRPRGVKPGAGGTVGPTGEMT